LIILGSETRGKTFFATDEQAMNWFVKRLYGLFKGFGPVGIDGPDFDLLTNQEIKIRVIRPQFQKDLLTYGLTWEDLYTLAILPQPLFLCVARYRHPRSLFEDLPANL